MKLHRQLVLVAAVALAGSAMLPAGTVSADELTNNALRVNCSNGACKQEAFNPNSMPHMRSVKPSGFASRQMAQPRPPQKPAPAKDGYNGQSNGLGGITINFGNQVNHIWVKVKQWVKKGDAQSNVAVVTQNAAAASLNAAATASNSASISQNNSTGSVPPKMLSSMR